MLSLLTLTALLAGDALAKTCYNATVDVPVTSRNGVFNKINTPQTNMDVVAFTLNATRQGSNGTQEALSGYPTVNGTYKISTQYCAPEHTSGNASNVLQILTHGIGFDKTYWDLPYHAFNYSYIDNALAHGYHTLSYDRIGVGNSSHGEPKNEIQAFLETASLAQITRLARNGSFAGIPPTQGSSRPRFDKIVHVGHSFGSSQTYALTAMEPSISDGIVLTGFSVNSTFTPYFLAGANFQQAHLGLPKPRNATYPPGYLVPANANANEFLFFYPGHFDPRILAFAEQSKKPVSVGELLTLGSIPMQSPFRGPVLVVTGSNDLPYCAGDCLNTGGSGMSIPAEAEMAFGDASSFEAYIQPNTGHGINLHYNATGAYEVIADWVKQNV
ncbi:Alpha/Beta hydrolase protein [Aspergillus unguis]